MIFTQFSKTPLMQLLSDTTYWGRNLSARATLNSNPPNIESLVRGGGGVDIATNPTELGQETGDLLINSSQQQAFYFDQIEPFDVVITAANEYIKD